MYLAPGVDSLIKKDTEEILSILKMVIPSTLKHERYLNILLQANGLECNLKDVGQIDASDKPSSTTRKRDELGRFKSGNS